MASHPHKHRGFSLVEVLITIVVVLIGLGGITASLTYGIKHSDKGTELTESSQIARTLLEYTQNTGLLETQELDEDSGLQDEDEVQRTLLEAPFAELQFQPHELVKYRRHIKVEHLSEDPDSHRFNLSRMLVTIHWSDDTGNHQYTLTGVLKNARPR